MRPRSPSGASARTARPRARSPEPAPGRARRRRSAVAGKLWGANKAELLYERRGPAAVITFNRPHARNAMTFAMYEGLVAHCDEIDADDDVRVVVLRGAGGRAFVSGTDIRQFLDFDSGRTGIEYEADIDRYLGRLDRLRTPADAPLRGYAVGAGLSIAAACDLRVCTPEAQFGLPVA